MLREEAELVAPQLSKLLKSAFYSYGHDFCKKKKKPQNVVETGTESNIQRADFLLFEVLRK